MVGAVVLPRDPKVYLAIGLVVWKGSHPDSTRDPLNSSWIQRGLELEEQCVCDVTHCRTGVERAIDFNGGRLEVDSARKQGRKRGRLATITVDR